MTYVYNYFRYPVSVFAGSIIYYNHMEVYIIQNGPQQVPDNFMYYITTDIATVPGVFVDVYEPAKAQEFLDK